MQKTILAAVFGVLMAGSAFADMSQGDGARSPMADGSGRSTFSTLPSWDHRSDRNDAYKPVACDPVKTDRIQAPTCGPVAGTSWLGSTISARLGTSTSSTPSLTSAAANRSRSSASVFMEQGSRSNRRTA